MTAIVKYNAGNMQSVLFALQRLGETAVWTDDPNLLHSADRVIFPGVGEASSAMQYLRSRGLDAVIAGLQQPVLGICLGMQLFCRHSEENNTDCLGIVDTQVCKFDSAQTGVKVPHTGWNTLRALKGPLFEGLSAGEYVYFVHSYYARIHTYTVATTDYGSPFSAALQRDNFYAVQFHPERSGKTGERILANFLRI
jgi:glutamine amidotransferase